MMLVALIIVSAMIVNLRSEFDGFTRRMSDHYDRRAKVRQELSQAFQEIGEDLGGLQKDVDGIVDGIPNIKESLDRIEESVTSV